MERILRGRGTRMRRIWRAAAAAGLAAAILASAGCGDQRGADWSDRAGNRGKTGDEAGTGRTGEAGGQGFRGFSLKEEADRERDGIIRLTFRDGLLYVPLGQLADKLEFKTSRDPETDLYRIGDNDVAFELKPGSRDALRYGDPVKLDKPAIRMNGELYIPLETVRALFAGVFDYEIDGDKLLLKPQVEPAGDDGLPDFKDDPYDPFTNRAGSRPSSAAPADIPADAKLKDIDVNALIETAHEYIGVPYVFGAKPYPQSKAFDCSSFVQYVFGKFGVNLPRSSRKQALVGKPVSRTSLRKADLLFFYLPGRYKSNDIVGHVGIYIGNGKMIHASDKPKDGVQVTDINKPFWKKTFLEARRVVY